MKALHRAVALCALALSTSASARPFTVDDFLGLESVGLATVDPTGRWLIQEMQSRYDAAPRFDNDTNTRPIHSHLLRVDLHHPGHAIPAFDQNPRGGYIPGAFSPSGRYLAVYRNLDRRWEIGILTIATRKVRWLGFGADFADKGDTLVWRSDTHLIALRMPPAGRYWKEELQQQAMLRLPGLWRAAVEGRAASAVTVGSGLYRDVHIPDPPRQVADVDAVTGRTRTLASGVIDGLVLSKSGRKLALLEAAGRVQLSGDQLLAIGTQFRRAALRLLDLDTGVLTTPCTAEPLVTSLRWSPTADTLLFYGREPGADWSKGGYRLVTADGGCPALPIGTLKPDLSLNQNTTATTAHGEWLGGVPIVLGAQAGATRSDWFAIGSGPPTKLTAPLQAAPADPVLVSADHAVFLDNGSLIAIDPAGRSHSLGAGDVTRIMTPRRPNVSFPVPEDGAPRLPVQFALAEAPTSTALWRFDGAAATRVLHVPSRLQRLLAVSDAGVVADLTDAHGVSRVVLTTPMGQDIELARANTQLADVDFPDPIAVEHPGPDGQPLKSWLYLPPQTNGGKPPLLVMAYPGASFASPPYNGQPGFIMPVSDNPRLAASHGYAVLMPSLPARPNSINPGKGWDAQLATILDAVAKTGAVDTDRVGYWGHSFGGYAGLMLATQTDRFKVIIAAAAMSDLFSMRGQGTPGSWLTPFEEEATQAYAGWSEKGAQGQTLGTPWTARERYVENSPVFFADRIHTPILLVQGDQDMNIAQGREMFGDLTRLGKDALFITFYGEGHNIVSPPDIRSYLTAAYGFLDRYLKPETPRASASPGR